MNGGWDDSGSGGGVLVERVPRRLEDSGTRRDRPAGGGSPVVPGVDRQKNAHSTSVQAGLGARTEQAPWEKVRGGRASAGHSPNAFAGASDLPAGKGAKAAQSPARSSVTGGSSASALGESKWERRDRSMPSWKGLHVDDLLPGARETVEVQMKLEREAEHEYQALAPLAFGTGPDALTIRHLLPDIYEGWQELLVAYRHRLRFAQALGRQGLPGEFWEREKAQLVSAEAHKLERLRLHCGREMALLEAREEAWARAIQPAESIKLQGTAGAAAGGGKASSLTSQERLRNELKKREKDLIRCTQAVTTAMTRYKAQHGKALMFRGMRYFDVMRFQRLIQEEDSKQRAKEAMLRRARRAL